MLQKPPSSVRPEAARWIPSLCKPAKAILKIRTETAVFGATVFGLSSIGIGVVIVIAGIGNALITDSTKDDVLQDWMQRCRFGELSGERYKTIERELRQFELAMKWMGAEGGERENFVSAVTESPKAC